MISLESLPWKTAKHAPRIEKGEQFVTAFETHWIKYALPILLLIILGTTSGLALALAPTLTGDSIQLAHIVFFGGLLLLVFVHHWFFHRILSEGMVDIIITNKRLMYLDDRLWFHDDLHELALSRIRALEAHKHGILQNLFQYGELWFDTGGSSLESGRIIPLIPHPHQKVKMLYDLLYAEHPLRDRD